MHFPRESAELKFLNCPRRSLEHQQLPGIRRAKAKSTVELADLVNKIGWRMQPPHLAVESPPLAPTLRCHLSTN
jgi:hypothetical protein